MESSLHRVLSAQFAFHVSQRRGACEGSGVTRTGLLYSAAAPAGSMRPASGARLPRRMWSEFYETRSGAECGFDGDGLGDANREAVAPFVDLGAWFPVGYEVALRRYVGITAN